MDNRRQLEEEFWKWWWVTTLSGRAILVATVCGPVFIVLIPVLVVVLEFRPVPLFLLGFCAVEKLVLYVALRNKPEFYQRCGTMDLFLCCVVGTTTIAFVGSQFGEVAGSNTAAADLTLLVLLVIKLVLQPFLCIASFKVYLTAQALAMWTALGFTLPLCERLFAEHAWKSFFQNTERALDMFGTSLVRLGGTENQDVIDRVTRPSECSCRPVMAFAILWVGWVVPSVFAYVNERTARLKFVRRSMRAHGYVDFDGGKASAVAVAMWIVNLIIFFELSWRFFKASGEYGLI